MATRSVEDQIACSVSGLYAAQEANFERRLLPFVTDDFEEISERFQEQQDFPHGISCPHCNAKSGLNTQDFIWREGRYSFLFPQLPVYTCTDTKACGKEALPEPIRAAVLGSIGAMIDSNSLPVLINATKYRADAPAETP